MKQILRCLAGVFSAAIWLTWSPSAFGGFYAMWSETIHNDTGFDAYDYHLNGTVLEGTAILQGTSITSDVHPFDWTVQYATVFNAGNIVVGWSGTTAVPTCHNITVSLSIYSGLENCVLGLDGYWTDADGHAIVPPWGPWQPLLGFQVTPAGTLFEQNATSQDMLVRNLQIAAASSSLALSDLVDGSSVLAGLTWRNLTASGTAETISAGTALDFDVNSDVEASGYGNYIVMRGEVFDPHDPSGGIDGTWHSVFAAHQIPEPGTLALGALGAAALVWRRRQSRPA
jgi:hypothetical protein